MKLNGGFSATILAIGLTSSLGWSAYVTKKLADSSERLARVEERVANLDDRIEGLGKRLGKDMESIHAGLGELLRLASPPPQRYDRR